MKTICGLDRPSFFLFRMPWLLEPWIDAATAPFYILFLLKINKRTVPALTCPYNYRHRMMIILFLLQAWHGYRWNSSCRKSVFSDLPWPTICVWFRTLFLESFSELRFRLCFFILNGSTIFLKKRRLPEKDSLKWSFFEDSYWQVGALYVLGDTAYFPSKHISLYITM